MGTRKRNGFPWNFLICYFDVPDNPLSWDSTSEKPSLSIYQKTRFAASLDRGVFFFLSLGRISRRSNRLIRNINATYWRYFEPGRLEGQRVNDRSSCEVVSLRFKTREFFFCKRDSLRDTTKF